jgi:hypothetical protein
MAQRVADEKGDSGSPILRDKQVGPWRILGTRPKPRPDSVLVYATTDGVFKTLDRPMTAGEWAFRGLRRIFEVDMATRRQVVSFSLPSKWDVPPFRATLEIWWRVVDPAQIVRERIADVGELFVAKQMVELREVARKFPYANTSGAERALNEHLPEEETWTALGAAKILRASLQVEQDKVVHGHQMDQLTERHQAHITGIRRESLSRFIDDGQLGMLAYHITQHPDDALAVADALGEQERISLETSLKIMLQAITAGKIQDVETERLQQEAIRKLMDNVKKPSAFHKLKDRQQPALSQAPTDKPSPEAETGASQPDNAAEKTVVDAEVVSQEQDDS